MSQWLTSVVAKIKKLGQGRSAPRPQRLAHLGVESLGGGSSLGGCRRLPVRPEVEQLEERRLMSSSGVISAVTDNRGQTTVFAIGTDQQVYEMSPSQTHGNWQALNDPGAGGFRQVSAGLDASGRAICYAIHASDGMVWRFGAYTPPQPGVAGGSWGSFDEHNLAYTATQISATRNNECFAIHTNYPSSGLGIYNGYSGGWVTHIDPWGGLVQITTGVDRYGQDEAYLLNGARQVYRLGNDGAGYVYWLMPMHATQISAGAGRNWTDIDLFYIDTSVSQNAYHYDGSSTKLMANYVLQISAGLDQYGNEVLYSIDMYYHDLWRHDLYGNVEREGGNVSQISAAGNDMVFAVAGWDTSVWVFDRNWNWNSYWASTNNWGNGGWHPLYGATANPYSALVAA